MVLGKSCWKNDEYNQASGITTERSKHPEFAVADKRAATFLTYPSGNCKTPEELVEAGYFYKGN